VTTFPLWLADFTAGGDSDGTESFRREQTRGREQTRVPRIFDVADTVVVAAIRAGDVRMFERMYEAYLHPLFDFAAAYVRDAAVAEEAVAAVLANLWARRTEWTVRESVEAYLFGAVLREVLTIRRTNARRAGILAASDEDCMSHWMGTIPPLPDAISEQHDLETRVWTVVDALPARYRAAVVLRWRRELSYDEMAEALDVSPVTARQLVSRAVRLIRERLGV
jgi:RNA polymerase sigma-70 factor (ECF subfamily)